MFGWLLCRIGRHRWQQAMGIEPLPPSPFIGEWDCPVGPRMMGCKWLEKYPRHRHRSGYACTRCSADSLHRR